jgi:hypothetical protein
MPSCFCVRLLHPVGQLLGCHGWFLLLVHAPPTVHTQHVLDNLQLTVMGHDYIYIMQ